MQHLIGFLKGMDKGSLAMLCVIPFLAIAMFVDIYLRDGKKDAAVKRVWYRWLVISVAIASAILISVFFYLMPQAHTIYGFAAYFGLLFMLGLLSYASTKSTVFCAQCGYVTRYYNYHRELPYCPRCGTKQ